MRGPPHQTLHRKSHEKVQKRPSEERIIMSGEGLSRDVAALAAQWLEWDMDPATKAQVQAWVDDKNERLVERVDCACCVCD